MTHNALNNSGNQDHKHPEPSEAGGEHGHRDSQHSGHPEHHHSHEHAGHSHPPNHGQRPHGHEHQHHEHHADHHEHPHLYRIQIDKPFFEVKDPTPTGRQLLEIAGKHPADKYAIYEKVKVGPPKRIPLNQHVDLRIPGVERFVTLPLDQTEGLGERHQFQLPEEDREWLASSGFRHEFVVEGNVLRVVLYGFPVPPGYNVTEVDLNVRIDPGYPDAQIDMVYFHPPLIRTNGRAIGALAQDGFDGKIWQRWSRHRTKANPWRPGLDCLMTHLTLVRHWLESELLK